MPLTVTGDWEDGGRADDQKVGRVLTESLLQLRAEERHWLGEESSSLLAAESSPLSGNLSLAQWNVSNLRVPPPPFVSPCAIGCR